MLSTAVQLDPAGSLQRDEQARGPPPLSVKLAHCLYESLMKTRGVNVDALTWPQRDVATAAQELAEQRRH